MIGVASVFVLLSQHTMAAVQKTIASTSDKLRVPLPVGATCAHIYKRLKTYDPEGDLNDVVCTGIDVPLPPGTAYMKITDRAFIDRENKRLWMKVRSLEKDYQHEPISMDAVKSGEFSVPSYNWADVKEMVSGAEIISISEKQPKHIMESIQFVRSLALDNLGGIVVIAGDIDKESDASCLVNDLTKMDVGLLEVVEGESPYAVVACIADHLWYKNGRALVFRK